MLLPLRRRRFNLRKEIVMNCFPVLMLALAAAGGAQPSRSQPSAIETESGLVVQLPLFNRLDPAAYGVLEPIEFTGFSAEARRHVHSPQITLAPVEGVTKYVFVLAQYGTVLGVTESDEPGLNGVLSGWDRVENGPAGWVVLGFDADGNKIALSRMKPFFKAPDFDPENSPEPKRPHLDAAWAVLDAIMNTKVPQQDKYGLSPTFQYVPWIDKKPEQKNWPDVVVTAAFDPFYSTGYSYPPLHDVAYALMVESLMPLAEGDRRAQLETLIRSVGDHILTARVPEDYLAKGLLYGCIRTNGEPYSGLYGASDEVREKHLRMVEPGKGASCGYSLLIAHDLLKDAKYLDAAIDMAEGLARLQQEDGSWAARIDGKTGEVIGSYASTAGLGVMFLDRLHHATGDSRWAELRDRALEWMEKNPLRTHGWVTNFDDGVAQSTNENPYLGLSNFDMLPFLRYLCAQPHLLDSTAVHVADELRWNDDAFVFYGPDPLLPFSPFYPSVSEQGGAEFIDAYDCWVPMDGHTANWALTLLAYHKLTGDEAALAKARAAADALTHVQLNDGRTTTWIPDATLGVAVHLSGTPSGHSWWPAGWAYAAHLWAELARFEKDAQQNPK